MSSTVDLTPYVEEYKLSVAGSSFYTPYWVNNKKLMAAVVDKWVIGPYQGKGSPSQIKAVLKRRLESASSKPSSPEGYRQFMRSIGLGIDCSGFVYHVLDRFLMDSYSQRLSQLLVVEKAEVLKAYDAKLSWRKKIGRSEIEAQPDYISLNWLRQKAGKNPRKITNVARLVSPQSASKLPNSASMQPGDMIKLSSKEFGDHIKVVVQVAGQKIVTAEATEPVNELGGVRYSTVPSHYEGVYRLNFLQEVSK